jgi:diphosphomevalonate decarboxylase
MFKRVVTEAHPNIALIKYWGKRDKALNLPAVGSISITLDTLFSRTELTPLDGASDEVYLDGQLAAKETQRLGAFVEHFRRLAGSEQRVRIDTANNFPTGAGLASSASGFAALGLACRELFQLELDDRALSLLVRAGSGSAGRSLFGGYVEQRLGQRADGEDAFAEPLFAAEHWPLRVAVAITSRVGKSVGSTEGMDRSAATSPYYQTWVDEQALDLSQARELIAAKDFFALAELAESSCLKMHAMAMASRPGLLYFNAATMAAMHAVRELRAAGVAVFFTVDAGPQVKAICLPEAIDQVRTVLRQVPGVLEVRDCALGGPARVVERE